MAKRLKGAFSRLSIMVVLEWALSQWTDYGIVPQKPLGFHDCVTRQKPPSVWAEYEGLKTLETDNCFRREWGNRHQDFEWVNHIEYVYGPNGRQKQVIHMVICRETWEEVAKDSAEIKPKTSRHVWISDKPFSKDNVHKRCNLCARHRWSIESGILVEKRQGYCYEHAFSYNWRP